MARAGGAFVIVLVVVVVGLSSSSRCGEALGVNWGTQASQVIQPSIIVRLLKDNGITRVKLFDADSWTLSALAGSGLQVMVAIPNKDLQRYNSYKNAKSFVDDLSDNLHDGGVDVRYVAVGNEPFLKSYNRTFENITLPAMRNVQKALEEAGLGDKIKVTTPLNADVYESRSDKPSDGNFRSDINHLMVDIVKFLHDKKSAFVVNIYPFLSLYQNPDFPVDFAFMDDRGKPIQDINNVQYNNVFDANYDTLVWALKRAKVPDLKIIVGEIGWPTDGDKNANLAMAKRFYDGLMKKLRQGKGTPLRPGPLDVYLFGLIDENAKSVAPGNFERHWGIFYFNGKPKFPMDLAEKGEVKMPVAAQGVIPLESQWCVFKKDVALNGSNIAGFVDYACSLGDCTSLGYKSSCNSLDARGNISYAYNMYFQMQAQDVEACDFEGTATITAKNPSKGTCVFPIGIENAGGRVLASATGTIIGLVLFGIFGLMQ